MDYERNMNGDNGIYIDIQWLAKLLVDSWILSFMVDKIYLYIFVPL
jgi:hypothetical protein